MFQTQTMCDDFYSYHNYRPLIFEELDLGNYRAPRVENKFEDTEFQSQWFRHKGFWLREVTSKESGPPPNPSSRNYDYYTLVTFLKLGFFFGLVDLSKFFIF